VPADAPHPSEAPTEQIQSVGRSARRGGAAAGGAGAAAAASRRGRRDTGGDGRRGRGRSRGNGDDGGRSSTDRKRGRRRNRRVLIVIAVLVLPFILGVGWFGYQLRPGSDGAALGVKIGDTSCAGTGTTDPVEIASGDRSTVAEALAQEGVIGSALAFKLWGTITSAGPFAEGCYELHESLGIRGAISALEAGPKRAPDAELLLPPGLTVQQIAERVGELPGQSAEKFLEVAQSGLIRSKYQPADVTSLEGLLFPDTYFIGSGETEEDIVRRLVTRFDEIGDRVNLGSSTRVTPYQAIIVASLIQTEAKLAEDAPLISAVVYNRIADGMQLQIDATLCYARLQATGTGCTDETPPNNTDKAIDSPYNTYRVPGLPPTPISSVTEASLEAALAPADVPFLFYVIADANGKHAFATTLGEHDANVAAARAAGLL
jgi:UPF0755 protein